MVRIRRYTGYLLIRYTLGFAVFYYVHVVISFIENETGDLDVSLKDQLPGTKS